MIPGHAFLQRLHSEALRVYDFIGQGQLVAGVTGGRDISNPVFVSMVLHNVDCYYPFNTVIHGAARGLDTWAANWARSVRKIDRAFPARWKAEGNAAGPIRNSDMIEVLENYRPLSFLIAFPGGVGTADMTAKANMAGLPVIDIQTIIDEVSV